MTFVTSAYSNTEFKFLDAVSSRDFLSSEDEYTKALSPLDLSLYHSTSNTISISQHLEFLKSTTLNWTEAEKELIQKNIDNFIAVIGNLNLKLNLPSQVLLIKTNGQDAFNSHYTRGNAIIFPANAGEIKTDLGTVYHEMFHIFSRNNPQLADGLYSLCGFKRIARLKVPSYLSLVRTTNPDAFNYDHSIKVIANGEEIEVVPFMYSAIKQSEISGPVNESLVYKLGLLNINTLEQTDAKMFKVAETNYKELVLANTHYYIHPEEIMAEDFKLLLLQNTPDISKPSVKYQAVLDSLQDFLRR